MTRDDQEILRERARTLARPVEDIDGRARTEILHWVLGEQSFAVPLADVQAIFPCDRLASVPHATAPLVGIVAFRGSLFPVYDPRALLGPAGAGLPTAPWAVLVDAAAPLGLLADGAPHIGQMRDAELRPPAGDLPPEARRCLHGVDSHGRALLTPDALRTDPRLIFQSDPSIGEPGP